MKTVSEVRGFHHRKWGAFKSSNYRYAPNEDFNRGIYFSQVPGQLANLHLHIWCMEWNGSDQAYSTIGIIRQQMKRYIRTFQGIRALQPFPSLMIILLVSFSMMKVFPEYCQTFSEAPLPRLKLMVSCFLVGHAHTTDAMWLSQRFTYHHRPNQWCLQWMNSAEWKGKDKIQRSLCG